MPAFWEKMPSMPFHKSRFCHILRPMELFQLRYFLEVAKQQHVRRSAEALHVSQPAVTKAIHRLESEIGVPLFVAKGRSIRLSPYGKFLYDELLPLCGSLDTLPDRIRSLRSQERVCIRLNVFAAYSIVMDAVLEFQRINPDIRFQVTRNEELELTDIAVLTLHRYTPKKRKDKNIFTCTEEILLAVPDTPRFRGGDSIRLDEVADMNFVLVSEPIYFRTLCDGFCKAAGVHLNAAFESDNPDAVRFMICNQAGVGFWPEFSLGDTFTDRLLFKHIEKPECTRDIVVERRDTHGDNIHVQVFFNYLSRYIDFYHKRHCGIRWLPQSRG